MNSPGILFWILSVVCVGSAVVTVTARRGLYVGIALVVTILSVMNLLIALGLIGLSFVYAFASLAVIASFYTAVKKSPSVRVTSINIESHSKLTFKFIIAVLIFVGCLILVSQTEIWQYTSEPINLSILGLLSTITEKYLLPFLFFKLFLFVLLVIAFFNIKRKSA